MDVAIEVAGTADMESLFDWLSGDPDLRGRVSRRVQPPENDQLGGIVDALVVAVGGGGFLTVLASALRSWIAQPRRSDIVIKVTSGPKGERTTQIDAKRVNPGDIDAILKQLTDGD